MASASATRKLLDAARSEATTSSAVESIVAPMALLLALRWADEHDAEQTAIAAFNGEEARLILPPGLRWSAWREAPRPLTSKEVAALWSGIRGVLALPPDPRSTHHEVRLPSGRLLSAIVGWLEQLTLDTPAARRQAGEAFTELVLQTMDIARFGGELVTPRGMGRLMVALADPQPGERIYDPCFGTGGLLVDAAEALWWRGLQVAPAEWTRAQRVPVFGVEKHVELHLVAFVRLLLAGVRPALEVGDALEREAAGRHHDQGFDCVLVDPPWGMKVEGRHLYDFPIQARTSENLFLQHAVRSLRPGGRAVVSAPPGLLFRGGADYEVRRWLLQECRVELVLRLPAKSLRYTAIAPTLLFVRRALPAETVRFVDLVSLPESAQASRALASALLANEDASPHTIRAVSVAELLKADARLVVSEVLEAPGDDRLAALAAADLRPLSEVAAVMAGVSVRRHTILERAEPGAVPLVRVGDLSEGVLRLGERFLRTDMRAEVREEQWVRRGDVLVSVDGTIGKVLFVQHILSATKSSGPIDETKPIAVAQKGLVIVRPHEVLDARFLAAVLASETYQRRLRSLARGETIAHLPLRSLRDLRVPVPPPAVQERVLRRLADQTGDAIEALLGTLAGYDEDPLARLFRENQALIQLTGEGIPEPEELHQLGLDTFAALRLLRNQAAHAKIDIGSHALRWLLTVGAAPVVAARRRVEGPDFETLDATKTMLDRALESARQVGGLVGRQATRLTERLILWVDAARTRSAGDFQLKIEHQFEELLGRGAGRLLVTIRLSGSVALREFVARLDISEDTVHVAELAPGEAAALRLVVSEDLPWETEATSLVLPCRLIWSAQRVDGQPVDGAEAVVLRHLLLDREQGAEVETPDLGVSPYITGDVVESPDMFFGRRSILGDIQTHLGGGTKVILLEGNRRTGKTSILRQLGRPEMRLVDSWVMVECSFQSTVGDATKDGIPTEGVFRLLVRDIGLACAKAGIPVRLPNMTVTKDLNAFRFSLARALNDFFRGIDPYEALQVYVDMVTEAIAPRRLLLMLDEFDKLQVGIDNGVTSPQVPENIRNLLQTRPAVAAILTGSRRLKRLREEYWSALFGFGHRIGIDPLELSEVRDLVTRPVAGRLVFDEASVDLIAELTARQPYLVQSLCARVFELSKRHGWRRIHREEVLEAVNRMVRDNEHFQALWSYAGTERRRYLLCLCNRLAEGTQRVNATLLNEHLDKAGIVVPIEHVDDDLAFLVELELVAMVNTLLGPQYELAVPLMRRWMEHNVDAEAQRRRALHEVQLGLGFSSGGSAPGAGRGDGTSYRGGLASDPEHDDGTGAEDAPPDGAPNDPSTVAEGKRTP
jgi:type I restriction enzyme M protein